MLLNLPGDVTQTISRFLSVESFAALRQVIRIAWPCEIVRRHGLLQLRTKALKRSILMKTSRCMYQECELHCTRHFWYTQDSRHAYIPFVPYCPFHIRMLNLNIAEGVDVFYCVTTNDMLEQH